MGSLDRSDQDGEGYGEDARAAGPNSGGMPDRDGWSGDGEPGCGDGVDLEAQAVEASAWLAGCRRAQERGEPDNAVDVGPIVDPELGHVVEALTAAVDGLAVVDLVDRDGKDLLGLTVAVNHMMDRLTAVRAHGAVAFDRSMEWALKDRTAGARLSHQLRVPDGNSQVRLGRNLATMPLTDEAFTAGLITQRHVHKLAPLAACDRTAKAYADYEETLVSFAKDTPSPRPP